MEIYNITFKKSSVESEDPILSFKVEDGNTSSGTPYNDVNGIQYTLTVLTMSYDKQMYKPGYLKVVLKMNKSDRDAKFLDHIALKNAFMNLVVNLETYGTSVAKNYVVFGVEPVYYEDSITLTLHIYSPDYWMTIDKYCKCYVHKRLRNIFKENAVRVFGFKENENLTCNSMAFLNIKYEVDKKEKSVEMIQPYLVQYNESFHHFIARTANRCGEPFYYENGKLILGQNPSDPNVAEAPELGSYDQVSFHDYVEEHKVAVEDWCRNGNGEDYSTENVERYATALPDKEHYITISEKDVRDPKDFMKEYSGSVAKLSTRILGRMLSFTNIFDGICNLVLDEAVKMSCAAVSLYQINDGFNKRHITGPNYPDDQKAGGKVTPFNFYWDNDKKDTYVNVIKSVQVNGEFYTNIRKGEMESSRNMLEAVIAVSNKRCFLLGSYFKFCNDTYVVVQVNYSIDSNRENGKITWTQRQTIKAVPVLSKNAPKDTPKDTSKDTPKETPKDVTQENSVRYFYPLPLPEGTICIGEPQTAYVTHNDDPSGIGRVRVRYPWQPEAKSDGFEDEVSSPWIRVVSPMAFNGGGFTLRPQVGSEVMLDYQNGNVERPYVVGGMFSSAATADGMASKANIIMKSPNGQFIRMRTTEDMVPFALGLASPVLQSMLAPVKASVGPAIKNDKFDFGADVCDRGLAGAIEMGDKFGIVGLNISTQDRKIAISSPFGTVSISAFQGISINAPNGDISIKGKNVQIEATNNLSITSGLNIKDKMAMNSSLRKTAKDAALNALKNVAKQVVDLSLLRTTMEVIIRPCEGTLKIKSYRYMQLEAGNGKTTIAYSNIVDTEDDEKRKKAVEGRRKFEKLVRTFNLVQGNVDELVLEYISHIKRIYACANHYNVLVKACKDDTVQGDAKDAMTLIGKKYNVNAELTAANVFVDNKNPQSLNQENEIVDAANRLIKSVKSFIDFLGQNTINGRVKIPGNVADVEIGDYTNGFSTFFIGHIPVKITQGGGDPNAENFYGPLIKFMGNLTGNTLYYRKVMRRKMIHLMVAFFASDQGGNKIIVEGGNSAVFTGDSDPDDYANDENWKKYVGKLKVGPKREEDSIGKKLKDAVLEGFLGGLDKWGNSERVVWGAEQRGQILMSDTPTETYAVEHGALVKMQNDGDNKDKTLQRILLGC